MRGSKLWATYVDRTHASEMNLQSEIRNPAIARLDRILDVAAERDQQREVLRKRLARADIENELVTIRAADRFVVKLADQLKVFGYFASNSDAGDPAVVAAIRHECAADLGARIEVAEIALHFDRQQATRAGFVGARVMQARHKEFDLDRKSTRLNSS